MKKLLLLSIVVLGFTVVSYAQPATSFTMSTTASATILKALNVTKGSDLSFGVLGPKDVAGSATISASNGDRSVTNLYEFSATMGAQPSEATFNISGTSGSSFSITLPSTDLSLVGSGLASGKSMIISKDSWTTNLGAYPSKKSSTLHETTGLATISVGATLSVGANQTPGNYSATFDFIVAYE